MAEEYQSQDRTEEPTPRKQEKAREEGQVVRSRELNSTAMLLAGSFCLVGLGATYANGFGNLLARLIALAAHPDGHLLDALAFGTSAALELSLPLLAVVFGSAIVAAGALGGFVFAPRALAFKGDRLNPLSGLKRMFALRALVELGKALAKVLVVGLVSVGVLHAFEKQLVSLGLMPIEHAMSQALSIVAWSLVALAGSLAVIAAIDVPYQLSEHKRQLRMTRQELKDELRDSEGRPEVKGRIRRLQQEIARRRMLADVPKADVVITNPEHYSVALKYDASAMNAPRVLAKGADLIALKIREVAAANEVAIVAAPPLARAIYWTTEIGAEIPATLYVATAQVLAYVYQLKQFRQGAGAAPRDLPPLDIPTDYRRDG